MTNIAIFAVSRKNRGYCIAGKCMQTRQWIRPICNSNGGEIPRDRARYKNSHGVYTVKKLQVIKMGLTESIGSPSCHQLESYHQPENRVVNDDEWQQVAPYNINGLDEWLDNPDTLWGVGNDNRVECALATELPSSLYLVKVNNLVLYEQVSGNNIKSKRVNFIYNNICYNGLKVTGYCFDNLYTAETNYSEAILCLSLGTAFLPPGTASYYHYKLVAAIYV